MRLAGGLRPDPLGERLGGVIALPQAPLPLYGGGGREREGKGGKGREGEG